MNAVLDFLLGVTGVVCILFCVWLGCLAGSLKGLKLVAFLVPLLIVSAFVTGFGFHLMGLAGWSI